MGSGGDRLLYPTNVAVIREVYDGEYSQQCFAVELDRALDAGCAVIVIEPTQLGDETARWISVGNCLHKTAVLTGLGAVVTGLIWSEKPLISLPLCGLSVLCTGLYTASWQFDNCVKYQVEKDPHKLARLPVLNELSAASPIVLVRKDDTKRKVLHCTISLVAVIICTVKLYRLLT